MLTASTRGVRVSVGRDDRPYYLGESDGGNTSHGRNPRVLGEMTEIVNVDPFTAPYNTNSSLLFFARFRAENGAFEGGNTCSRTIRRPAAAGVRTRARWPALPTAKHDDDRRGAGLLPPGSGQEARRGTPLSQANPDAFVLVASSSFKRRLWTTWSGGGASQVAGVALGRGAAAVVTIQDQKAAATGSLITFDAIQPTPPGGASDTFLSVFPAP